MLTSVRSFQQHWRASTFRECVLAIDQYRRWQKEYTHTQTGETLFPDFVRARIFLYTQLYRAVLQQFPCQCSCGNCYVKACSRRTRVRLSGTGGTTASVSMSSEAAACLICPLHNSGGISWGSSDYVMSFTPANIPIPPRHLIICPSSTAFPFPKLALFSVTLIDSRLISSCTRITRAAQLRLLPLILSSISATLVLISNLYYSSTRLSPSRPIIFPS